MSFVGKEPDAFTGATRSGYHAGLRASQKVGSVEIESGIDLMNNRQTMYYNDALAGFSGTRELCVNQVNVPLTLGIHLFPGKYTKAGLKLSAGYLTQFNHLYAEDEGILPAYELSKRSSGATLSLQGNLLTENGKPRLGLYGSIYRGSRIFTDPYNPADAEIPGSSFAAFWLKVLPLFTINFPFMTRYLFAILLIVHGSIHLMGFLKAFGLARLDELDINLSRAAGAGWLVAAVLFFAATLLYLLSNEAWPFVALAGIVVSTVLIIISWHAAKFGMLPNAFILAVAAMWFGMHVMDAENRKELQYLFSVANSESQGEKTQINLPEKLPQAVARWIERCGIATKPHIGAVLARQELKNEI